jgi:hypothetical protein
MRPTPLFDTNIFSDVATGKITPATWASLKKVRPRRGWPLSCITAMELLAGIDKACGDDFESAQIAIAKSYELSSGRVLKEPRALLCEELLKCEFPEGQIEPKVLSRHLLVVSRAKNKQDLLKHEVFIRQHSRRTSTYAGFDPSIVATLMEGPKEKWVGMLEAVLTEAAPSWRDRVAKGEPYFSAAERDEVKRKEVWVRKRSDFLRAFTDWLSPDIDEEELRRLGEKMDLVLTFAIAIVKEVLLRNYSFSKHDSDMYDLLQLHYLAFDRYVFVTADDRLRSKLSASGQAGRLLNLHEFLNA